MSKNLIIRLTLFLILGMCLNEVSIWVYWFNPATASIYPKHLYLDKNYDQPEISVSYFIYELCPYLDNIIRAAVLYKICSFINFKLKKIAYCFTVYYVAEAFLYVWNRNTNGIINFIIIIVISVMAFYDKEDKKLVKLR